MPVKKTKPNKKTKPKNINTLDGRPAISDPAVSMTPSSSVVLTPTSSATPVQLEASIPFVDPNAQSETQAD